MLALFYGNDAIRVREAAYGSIAENVLPVTIDSQSYRPGVVAEASESASLFDDTMTYILDTPSEQTDFKEEVDTALPALAVSPHQFIIIEGTLLAADKKKYEKYAETIETYATTAERRFNAFSMADALASRDKKKLWLLLHEAFREGLSSEEIIGTLWWQLKTMRLAEVTNTAAEAGIKDFPYNKAKRSLRSFSDGELASISHALLDAYHDARLGKLELDLALERWVLSL